MLSFIAGTPTLLGLSGALLKERMKELGFLDERSIKISGMAGLRRTIEFQAAGDYGNFTKIWDILGELLAHSSAQDDYLEDICPDSMFLDFLARYLETSFSRLYDGVEKELRAIDPASFREPIEAWTRRPHQPHHFFHATKYAALTWSDYFAIKLLWLYAPEPLLALAEIHAGSLPAEADQTCIVPISLLSQIVSEIALSVQLEIRPAQKEHLVQSGTGVFQWLGWNAIERELHNPNRIADVSKLVATLPYPRQVEALGWMVNHAAKDPDKSSIYAALVNALQLALPSKLAAKDLAQLIDALRGHMRTLPWAAPWLFRDVVLPLIRSDRIRSDDACAIWVEELTALVGGGVEHEARMFVRAREGETLQAAAFLLAQSGPEQHQSSLRAMKAILKRQQRIVQQPLASTSDWSRWDTALCVAMWVLGFARWTQFYLRERGVTDGAIERLAGDAYALASIRPMSEWRAMGAGEPAELADFIDDVNELLSKGPAGE